MNTENAAILKVLGELRNYRKKFIELRIRSLDCF